MKRKMSTNINNALLILNTSEKDCQANEKYNSQKSLSDLKNQNKVQSNDEDEQKSRCKINKQSLINKNGNQTLNFPVKKKLNFKSLQKHLIAAGSKAHEESKNKSKTVVNLESMKEELKQLEDPPLTQRDKDLMASRLTESFFDQPCEQLAQNLLGKILVRKLENGTILKGRIVETESYLGAIDKASHTYQNRVTARNLPMYMPPGTIYVYFIFGMYSCFNISSQGDGCAVLIRALEPINGLKEMEKNRNSIKKSSKNSKKKFKSHELCNGPSKLCMSYSLYKII